MNNFNIKGFTLIEVLISLLIFTFLAIMLNKGVEIVINSKGKILNRVEELREYLYGIEVLKMDLIQLKTITRRDIGGLEIPSMRINYNDKELLSFVKLGSTVNEKESAKRTTALELVNFVFKDKKLIKYVWDNINPALSYKAREIVLLENVDDIKVRYLINIEDGWQDGIFETTSSIDKPKVIEITWKKNNQEWNKKIII